MFIRYQAAQPNRRGTFPGVFALCNGLARGGALTAEDLRWWRVANAAFDAAYLDPGAVDPGIFDCARHPVVSCWFKESATDLLAQIGGHLDLLDRYGVGWTCLRSQDPGAILYEDVHQVVVEPARCVSVRQPVLR